jgi:hypothetical protein
MLLSRHFCCIDCFWNNRAEKKVRKWRENFRELLDNRNSEGYTFHTDIVIRFSSCTSKFDERTTRKKEDFYHA